MLRLMNIQQKLKAPKNQRNNFGNYNYRSAEDILEAVKSILKEEKCVIIIGDDIVSVGNRTYVKATARLISAEDGKEIAYTSALAREPEAKKGQDDSQITGATSSYARKYALNGLLCIDDTKDADATNTHGMVEKTPAQKAQETKAQNKANFEERFAKMYAYFKNNPKWSYYLEDRFNEVMAEAYKRKYDEEKQQEMCNIFNALEKDSIPNF